MRSVALGHLVMRFIKKLWPVACAHIALTAACSGWSGLAAQPCYFLECAPGPPPSTELPVADMRAPIDNLFAAWRALDVETYIAQWAPEAVKIDLKARTRKSPAQLAGDRRELFSKLSRVNANYQVQYRGVREGIGSFDVTYSLTLHYRNGRIFSETACESYKVSKRGIAWLIVENEDYKPC
jgi:hypothetical protein